MKTWNIGNTTVRNPQRLREALQLFRARMGGRPFRKAEQIEFQGAMIDAGLVDSTRYGGDDGGRKFASAFKQLGFITDWSKGQLWQMTLVGTLLIEHPALEETIFLRQLLKYQIPSPEELLESIREGSLIGRETYAPAYFEWAIWRLFLAINALAGPISQTRGFNIDDDIHPTHHARGGAACALNDGMRPETFVIISGY